MDDIRITERFFDNIAAGGITAIYKVKHEIENDPKKYFYDTNNPNHIVNRRNR